MEFIPTITAFLKGSAPQPSNQFAAQLPAAGLAWMMQVVSQPDA